MDRDQMRLECLKLAVTKSPSQQEILAKAEEFVKFVYDDGTKPQAQTMASKPAPNVGNAKP